MTERPDYPEDPPEIGVNDIVRWNPRDDEDLFDEGVVRGIARNGVLTVEALYDSNITRPLDPAEVVEIEHAAGVQVVEEVGHTAITVGEGIQEPEAVRIPVTVNPVPAEAPSPQPAPEMTQAEEVVMSEPVQDTLLVVRQPEDNPTAKVPKPQVRTPIKAGDVHTRSGLKSPRFTRPARPTAAEATAQPITYDSPKRGIWRSSGPQGQDNPEADVVGEVSHTDGRKFYRMSDPEGSRDDWYAPADEVEIVESPSSQPEPAATTTPESEQQPAPAEEETAEPPDEAEREPTPELGLSVLETLQESITNVEADASRLNQLLEETITKARHAINAGRLDVASNLYDQANNYRKGLKRQIKRLKFLQKKYKVASDLLNPANILELKDKIDSQLNKERDRRSRIQDHDPIDDYAQMLKHHLIEGYTQTGADPNKPRNISPELMQEIMANLGQSYDQLQASLGERSQPADTPPPSPPTPSTAPNAEPAADEITEAEPSIDSEAGDQVDNEPEPLGDYDTPIGPPIPDMSPDDPGDPDDNDITIVVGNNKVKLGFMARTVEWLESQPRRRRRVIEAAGFLICCNLVLAPIPIAYVRSKKKWKEAKKEAAKAAQSLPISSPLPTPQPATAS